MIRLCTALDETKDDWRIIDMMVNSIMNLAQAELIINRPDFSFPEG